MNRTKFLSHNQEGQTEKLAKLMKQEGLGCDRAKSGRGQAGLQRTAAQAGLRQVREEGRGTTGADAGEREIHFSLGLLRHPCDQSKREPQRR